jgi:hypothetical protein
MLVVAVEQLLQDNRVLVVVMVVQEKLIQLQTEQLQFIMLVGVLVVTV